ncbi:MAG: PIN domain-containing protein [Desulfosalsimonadaceae bacterium]
MTSTAQAELQSALIPGSFICLDTNCLLYYFKGEMPWAESLRPVFDAKDGGHVRLFTSSLTLAELLARVDPTDQSAMLSAVRQYFDLIPVDDNIGIHAAGIRRASNPNNAARPPVKTPDAVEMATANETRSLLFITNDEQLTRMPQTVKALYLKDLALDWLEDELDACLSASATVAVPSIPPQQLNLSFYRDVRQDWMTLHDDMSIDDFVRNAMLLSALIKGPCAVIGQAQGANGTEQVHALRVLPAGRPWITPSIPDWVRQFTNRKHQWDDPAQAPFVQRVGHHVGMKDEERKNQGNGERAMPFIVVSASQLDAEAEVNAMDGNGQMAEHKKRQEIRRRYIAPFKPVMPLLELPGARLWKTEAQNAHELEVDRFRRFFACAENVIGKEGGR